MDPILWDEDDFSTIIQEEHFYCISNEVTVQDNAQEAGLHGAMPIIDNNNKNIHHHSQEESLAAMFRDHDETSMIVSAELVPSQSDTILHKKIQTSKKSTRLRKLNKRNILLSKPCAIRKLRKKRAIK